MPGVSQQSSVKTESRLDPTGKSDKKDIFDVIRDVQQSLSGLSNRDSQRVLTAVCALHGLRVGPSLATIVAQQQGARTVQSQAKPAKGSKGILNKKADWKLKPEWLEIQTRHSAKVAEIKVSEVEVRPSLVVELHHMELEMKELKQKLRSFHGESDH